MNGWLVLLVYGMPTATRSGTGRTRRPTASPPRRRPGAPPREAAKPTITTKPTIYVEPVFVLAPSRSRRVPATVLAALFLVATLAALAVDSSAVANVFRSLVVPPSPSPVRVSTYVPLVRRGVLSWLLP